MLASAHERIMMMTGKEGSSCSVKAFPLLSLYLWSPPGWESSSLYTHHPRRILEMIIITQYEYLYSGPDSKRKWRGASGQQRGRKRGGILKIGDKREQRCHQKAPS